MGVKIPNLNDLDQASVEQFDKLLTQLIQELDPTIDVKSGPFHDLVLHLKAILDAGEQTNIDLIRQANSLLAISQNSNLADTDVVDRLLSNYNITRNPGTKARGDITIILDQLTNTVIGKGSVFIIDGLKFTSPVTYVGRTTSATVIGPNDRLIIPVSLNQYAFTITLEANDIGTSYNVLQSTTVVPANPPAHFVKAYVAADFTNGTNAQTNQELIDLLAAGMAIAAWSNRISIESLIRKQTTFATIKNLSIIGFGDPEMLRDQHSIWPGSTGGRSDLYLRSQELYQNIQLTKSAVLVAKAGPIGTWQFGIGRDDAPGFYKVDKILLPSQDLTDPGWTPSSEVRSLDLTGVVGVPDLISTLVNEGIYSRYQAAVIQFVDTTTDATALTIGTSTNEYKVLVQAMPLIADLQSFLLTRDVAPPQCDVLVKAPIPCYTEVTFTVNYDSTTTAPSIPDIQTAVASAVNNLSFPGSLSASFIDQVLHNLLPNLVSVTNMSLAGLIRRPNGTTIPLASTTQITIPSEPANMISGRTTVFFLAPEDVNVTLNPVVVPNV
jgi:hypothetical protein